MTYKDVVGEEESVWFCLRDMKREGKKFLQWAKDLGCVWMNGEEIEPRKGVNFFHIAMYKDGKLANVGMFAFMNPKYKDCKRIVFADYIKGKKSPLK